VVHSKKGYTLIEKRELNGFKSLVSFIPSTFEGTSYFKNKCSLYVIHTSKKNAWLARTLFLSSLTQNLFVNMRAGVHSFSPNHRSVMDKGGGSSQK
jgi:hypothetical protein